MTKTEQKKAVWASVPLDITLPKVLINYRRGEKNIFARDLTDGNNEPACYTTSKRGLDPVWLALIDAAKTNPALNHGDVMKLFSTMNIRYHYWCMMD